MNIQKYIESDILERYATGVLNEQEEEEVDLLLAQHIALGEALEKIYVRLESKEKDDG